MSYYADNAQWAAAGQPTWDHQTPPPAPARSGANSVNPRERDEPTAFWDQFEEVDRALDNLVKSGKMFASMPGARRESHPLPGPGRSYPVKGMGALPGSRPHSMADLDARGPQPPTNLQNFYATHRQPSRGGSNEAEQIMQAKRRQAAQRERELRNYHQDQQFNRSVLSDGGSPYNSNTNTTVNTNTKPDRVLSPGAMSEADRRQLIARQRSALYGEGPFADRPGYIDETGTPRPGLPTGTPNSGLRGHSPLNFEYGRNPTGQSDSMPSASALEGAMQPQLQQSQQQPAGQRAGAGGSDRSRTNSNASPQAATPGHRSLSNGSNGPALPSQPTLSQATNTRVSSPGGSPPHRQVGIPGSKPAHGSVAPIGTRPSVSGPASAKTRGTPPLSSPLNQGFTGASNETTSPGGISTSGALANQSLSASGGDSPSVALAGWGGRSNGWGSKSGLGAQTPVWG